LVSNPDIPSVRSIVNDIGTPTSEGALDGIGVWWARMKLPMDLASRLKTDQVIHATYERITDAEISQIMEMLIVAPQQVGPSDPQGPGD